MFINKDYDNNGIRDDELENKPKRKFSLFKKKPSEEENIINNYNNPDNSNDVGGVDYNQKYLDNNRVNNKSNNKDNNTGEIFKIIRTIVIFVIFILFIIFVVPRLLHYDETNKEEYVKTVKEMTTQVINFYNRTDVKCSTASKGIYYFNVNKSDEIFGSKVKSPFLKNSMQGYIEFDMKGDNISEVYVSFTDGLFGFDRVKYNDLKASDVKLFSYLSLDRHEEMLCNKQFVFSN